MEQPARSATELSGKEESKGGAGPGIETSSKSFGVTMYNGYHKFEVDSESYEKILAELCPIAAQASHHIGDQSSLNIVSLTNLG
jgi:hypothetical protein